MEIEASDLLAQAITAYTHHGASKIPRDDREAVLELGGIDGATLWSAVDAALTNAESVDMSDVPIPSNTAGATYRERLRAARPDLTDTAVDALTNRWFYRRLWLDAPTKVERPRVQYFARFSIENGQRVPYALFRREDDGTTVTDTVLKDVGSWRADRNRVIWSSMINRLESNIEPITARQAEEFEQMVAVRTYRPFSS
jgi:hypothetical protein